MKVLILGGSYFVGKAITERLVACKHNVTLLNRGTRTLEHVSQIKANRESDVQMKTALADVAHYDSVVDVSCMTD